MPRFVSTRKAKTAVAETPSSSDDDFSLDEEEGSDVFEEEDEEDGALVSIMCAIGEILYALDCEFDDVGGFEDVDVAELCTMSTTNQDRIIREVHQRETERYFHELASLEREGKDIEAFSELNVRSFLNKAKFDSKVNSCRSRMCQQYGDSTDHRYKVRRIATNVDRRFIFEKEVVRSSHMSPAKESYDHSKSSLGPCVGRMLPGESIIDGCERLKREKRAAAAAATAVPAKEEEESSDIEWEGPVTFPSIQSDKQKPN